MVIFGKDPYRLNANGVPFAKDTWEELSVGSSGRVLLSSLLGNNVEALFDTPRDAIFYSASELKVVLLNASYEFLNGKAIKRDHIEYINFAWEKNKDVYKKAKLILLCGSQTATMLRWAGQNEKKFKFKEHINIPHPCYQSRLRSGEKWEVTWGQKGFLKRLLLGKIIL